MRHFRLALALWLACASAAFGAEPFARATIDDQGAIVPGQQVHVTVEVFAPNFFTSPPQFPLFDLPNAVVTLPDERALNLNETVDEVQYSGIRRAYMIVPEMAGTFTLPPVAIDFDYSDDGKTVKGTASLPLTSFTVGDAPGGEGKTLPFAARGVTLTQSFDRDPAKLKVGEALVRTVTVFGTDTQAMMIPSLDLGQPHGLKVYPKPPVISDGVEGDGGTVGSSRAQTIIYIAQAAGTFEIPEVSSTWFDLDAHAAKIASLPARVVTVTNVPAPAQGGIAPQLQTENSGVKSPVLSKAAITLAAAVLSLLAGIVWLSRRLLPPIKARLSTWNALRRSSEKTRFKQLVAAIRKDDPATVYHRLVSWSRSAGFRLIGDWISATNDADVARQTGTLERQLFANEPDRPALDREALLRAITKARRAHIGSGRSRPISRLPELNPT